VPLIPLRQRPYLRSHPLAAWFAVAIFLAGLIGLLFPETVSQTAASLLLPDWLETTFRWFYLVAGAAATWGIVRGRANLEAAGWTLVTSVLAAQIVTLLFLTQDAAIVANLVTLAALALGTGMRAWFLAVDLPRARAAIVLLTDNVDQEDQE
jgi:hypothetical protein